MPARLLPRAAGTLPTPTPTPTYCVCVSFVKMKRKLEAADPAMEASHFCSDVHTQRAATSSGTGFTLELRAAARVAPGVLWG